MPGSEGLAPYAAHQALSVLEAHTITPADAKERAEVFRSLAVLSELAQLYMEATENDS
ncbi:hypothetical protein GCM10018787_41980 [Streptomyces thermodiastaticus]|nr:hypothetical protein GCM10018787_41980 [Streptomyces thermodiastaticus]